MNIKNIFSKEFYEYRHPVRDFLMKHGIIKKRFTYDSTYLGMDYVVPDAVKEMITPFLLARFISELRKKYSPDNFNLEWLYEIESTIAWGETFENVCKEANLNDLAIYYKNVNWPCCDHFDAYLTEMIVEYGLMRN